jgi:hypothetical protein
MTTAAMVLGVVPLIVASGAVRCYSCDPDRSERAPNVMPKIRVDVEASAGVGW